MKHPIEYHNATVFEGYWYLLKWDGFSGVKYLIKIKYNYFE